MRTQVTSPRNRPPVGRRFALAGAAVAAGLTTVIGSTAAGQNLADTVQVGGAATHADALVVDRAVGWTPQVLDGEVQAVTPIGDTVYVGGKFTNIRTPDGPTIRRPNLFAFDRSTGELLDSFAPEIDNEVFAIVGAPDGNGVIIGGRFNTVNGEAQKGVARLDPTTGARDTGFTARTNARVDDLAVAGNRVILAGIFTTVGNTAQTGLAAIDGTTGAVDASFAPVLSGPRDRGPDNMAALGAYRVTATPDGQRVVAIGNFSAVNGQTRHQIALFELGTSPRLAVWAADWYEAVCPSLGRPSYVTDVAVSPDGSYAVVTATGQWRGSQYPCDSVTRLDLDRSGTGIEPTWIEHTGGDSTYSVAISDTAVYVGGHQRWANNPWSPGGNRIGPGAIERTGFMALDPVNGMALPWDPTRNPRGVGVLELTLTDAGLWVGSDTDAIGGQVRPRVHFMPIEGGTPLPDLAARPVPGTLHVATDDGLVTAVPLTRNGVSRASTVDVDPFWAGVDDASQLPGYVYAVRDGQLMRSLWSDGLDDVPAPVDLRGVDVDIDRWEAFFVDPVTRTLYYSLSGDSALYAHRFQPDLALIDPRPTRITDTGIDWSTVEAATLGNGLLVLNTTTGHLLAVDWSSTWPSPGPVAGTSRVISGPGTDGRAWTGTTALFLDAPGTNSVVVPNGLAGYRNYSSTSIGTRREYPIEVTNQDRLVVRVDLDEARQTRVLLINPAGNEVGRLQSADRTRFFDIANPGGGEWTVVIVALSGGTAHTVLVNPTDPERWPSGQPPTTTTTTPPATTTTTPPATTTTTPPATTTTTPPATTTTTPPATTTTTPPATTPPTTAPVIPRGDGAGGFVALISDGRVVSSGLPLGSLRADVTTPAVDVAVTPDRQGAWVLEQNGTVHALGSAPALQPLIPSQLIAGEVFASLASTEDGKGIWAITDRGRILPAGTAPEVADLTQLPSADPTRSVAEVLNGPVVDAIPAPTGGFWLLATDGGVFALDGAPFYGSMGGIRLNAPTTGMVADVDRVGYWLVATDGGVFSFDAEFSGSLGATGSADPIRAILPVGTGYLITGVGGTLTVFGTTVDDRPALAPGAAQVVALAAP